MSLQQTGNSTWPARAFSDSVSCRRQRFVRVRQNSEPEPRPLLLTSSSVDKLLSSPSTATTTHGKRQPLFVHLVGWYHCTVMCHQPMPWQIDLASFAAGIGERKCLSISRIISAYSFSQECGRSKQAMADWKLFSFLF
jgi:hypothetical protein